MKRKTDVFFIHLYNDYSGSPRVFADVIKNCDCSGNKTLLTSKHDGFLNDLLIDKITIYYNRSSNRLLVLFNYFLSQICIFFVLFYLLMLSSFQKRNKVVFINTMLPFAGLLSAKLWNAKVICYVHEVNVGSKVLKIFLRFVIECCADQVVFVSHFLYNYEKFNKPKQIVICNGLRSDFNASVSLNLEVKFSSRAILFAGSLKSYKGIYQLLEIASLLPSYTVNAAFNCTNEELDLFIENNFIPNNMKLYSRPDNIDLLYQQAFCVCNLSLPEYWIETFGLSLLEGMSFGCPVIAPPIGGPTDFVDDNCGLLSDSRDIQSIVHFIEELGNDYSKWLSFSNSAIKISKNYSYSKFKENLNDFLSDNDLRGN